MKRPFDASPLTVAARMPWRLPLYLALLVLCGARILPAQPTLKIIAPADGTVIHSGQPFTVEVEAAPGAFRFIGVVGMGGLNSDQPLSAPPYRFALQTEADGASGKRELKAIGVRLGEIVYSTAITVDVERSDSPQQLLSEESGLIFGFVGDITALGITGVFSDGSRVGLNRSTLTAYSSDTPAVATVDSNGLVTAVGSGFANLTVTYLNWSIHIPVAVPQPITISPTVASLFTGQTMEFSAELSMTPGIGTSVTWSINPQLGSIDNTGLYTAPSSVVTTWQGVTVTATSVANPTISASGQIWLFAPVSVALSPSTAILTAGQALTLTPTVVNGGDAVNGSAVINWSISPSGVGAVQNSPTLNQNTRMLAPGGTYYAPGVITSPQTVTITATSGYDNSKAASAQVTLVPSVAVSISPPSSTLYGSRSQQFAAMVNFSSNATVTWSISPNVGTIDATGLYTAPATIFYRQTVTVTATSVARPTKSGSALVSILPPSKNRQEEQR